MKKLYIFLFIFSTNSFSQTFSNSHFGLSTGIIVTIGSHINAIGLNLKTYYTDYCYQINIGSSIVYNLNSYGERKKYWETRSYTGFVLLGGKKTNSIDFQLDGLSHQTNYQNAIGYNYIWYYDNAGTSQRSGGFSLSLNKIGIYFENDVFGGQAKDRYRTGHLMVTYRDRQYKIGTGIYLWTGETDGAKWNKTTSSDCPYGFKDLSELPFGKTSHGILYGSLIANLPFGQIAQIKIGLDSEQIRNSVQNKLVHDLTFLPKSVKHNTPHYPRLNEHGYPVFTKGEMRKNKLYLQLGE